MTDFWSLESRRSWQPLHWPREDSLTANKRPDSVSSDQSETGVVRGQGPSTQSMSNVSSQPTDSLCLMQTILHLVYDATRDTRRVLNVWIGKETPFEIVYVDEGASNKTKSLLKAKVYSTTELQRQVNSAEMCTTKHCCCSNASVLWSKALLKYLLPSSLSKER